MSDSLQPPLRFRFRGDDKSVLVADWRDGHESAYPLSYLRGWCPCAACQGHSAHLRFVPTDGCTLTAIVPVGTYAIQLGWSDGHGTGIHTFETLRATCPCTACGGPTEGTPDDVATACADANR
jgi:DUF971 family protein